MSKVTGIILAGGAGSRLGGADKGLQRHAGRPLIEWVIERLQPQVDSIVISCNRNLDHYSDYGFPVFADRMPLYSGPLAGLARVLPELGTPYCVTVPCDNPGIPRDLVKRLRDALAENSAARVAVGHDGTRLQPLYALLPAALGTELDAWLKAGGRAPREWYPQLGMQLASFADAPGSFDNLNTPDELGR